MSEQEIDRKIAVIFATDVVGYSKHMEADESGTIKSLRACEKILTELFDKHKGRLFNTGGDSFLAEFPSAVSAVECAVEFQKAIKTKNLTEDGSVKLEFRIGINSGDVVKEKENLLGDGVNIAARLEALAQTGGITISKAIFDFVKGKTKHEFNDLGIQKIKQNEFHAFDLLLEPVHKRKIKKGIKVSRYLSISAAIIVSAIITAVVIGIFNQDKNGDGFSDLQVNSIDSSLPTMLVYPFVNLTSSDEGANLSAAITESMISSLSRYNGLSVLSSSTSNEAKTKGLTDLSIQQLYNADFIIRGSIQSVLNQSRIQMQLTDLSLNKVVWTDTVNFAPEEIFEVQDRIGDEILAHLQINAVAGSEAKSWAAKYGNTERLTLFLNSRDEWFKFTPDAYLNHSNIIKQLEEQLGENSPVLYNIKGWNLFLKMAVGKSTDQEKDRTELLELSELDVLENNDVTAFNLRALVEFRVGSKDCETSKRYARKASELGATVDTYVVSGSIWVECGDLKQGTEYFEKALQLQPNDNGWNLTKRLVPMYYLQNEYDKINRLVAPQIDAIDIPPEMLAFYSLSQLREGNEEVAMQVFQKAKSLGITKKSLERVIRNPEKTTEFISSLSNLGDIN
jgi:adenylate cyclase